METLTRAQERKIAEILDLWTHDLIRSVKSHANKEQAIKNEVSRVKWIICDSDEVQTSKQLAEAC
jgi:hypothetical protein